METSSIEIPNIDIIILTIPHILECLFIRLQIEDVYNGFYDTYL